MLNHKNVKISIHLVNFGFWLTPIELVGNYNTLLGRAKRP